MLSEMRSERGNGTSGSEWVKVESVVCNLERGVKIAVERAAREREWSLGDKSRRRYNVGALITDPQAMEHALQRISYTRYIQITMCTYLITCILLLLGFLQSLNHDRQELQYVIHIYVIDETMC